MCSHLNHNLGTQVQKCSIYYKRKPPFVPLAAYKKQKYTSLMPNVKTLLINGLPLMSIMVIQKNNQCKLSPDLCGEHWVLT